VVPPSCLLSKVSGPPGGSAACGARRLGGRATAYRGGKQSYGWILPLKKIQ